jgi:hypothetical protein
MHHGKQKSIAVTSFMVKDGTPPVVSILSPASNQYFNSKIDISALAIDLVSGIDKVEYQVDGGSWKLLPVSDPSQGRYSTTWNPTHSDEGIRTIRVRATDRAGNTSLPLSVLITIDLTPPKPPVILSPPDNSTLSSEVIDIQGTAEQDSMVEMAFTNIFKTRANSVTGEFVFKRVMLTLGKNVFVFKASDMAGNVSAPKEYILHLKIIPILTVITDRAKYNPFENVTITSAIQNPSQNYTLQSLMAKVSVMNSQGTTLFTDEKPVQAILPGQFVELGTTWNTSANPKGTYTLKLEILEGGAVLTESTSSFEIIEMVSWGKTYGGQHYDVAYSIQQTQDNGYIMAGETWSFGSGNSDAWVLKLDAKGNIEWQKTYGAKHHDVAYSIQQTRDRGYIMAGEADAVAQFFGSFWVAKLDERGNIEWQKTYGHGWANSIQQTSEDGYIVAGMNEGDAWVIKLDIKGEIQWQKTYRGMHGDWAHSVKQTSEGGYVVAGMIRGDAWVIKLNENGETQWQKTYGSCGWDAIFSIQQTQDGGYVMASMSSSFGGRHTDFWVVKLNAGGKIQWQKAYGGSKHDVAHVIQQTSEGGYIMAGWTQSFGEGSLDAWVLKLNSSGDIEWQKTYGGSEHDAVHSVQQTSDGGYIVAGWTQSFGEGNLDAWVLKLSADGDISSCQEGLIGTTDVIPYNTKASVRRSSVTGQNTHLIPQESHQSVKDTYVISGDVCVDTAPDISVQPDSHMVNFGNVIVGSSSTKYCTVFNKGMEDLKINSIKITEIPQCNAAVFSQKNNCSVLPSGGSCDIAVKFRPTSSGEKNATLEIFSNDPDENSVRLILSGKGIKE